MKIPLDGKYFLTSDKRNYIIGTEMKPTDKGVVNIDAYGYYSDLDNAFKAFTDIKLRMSDATTWMEVKAILVDLRRLYQEIRDIVYHTN